MPDIIIYGAPQSTYVRTVRMTCEEKDVGYTLEPADLGSEDYRRIHPFGKMPAMRHGDFTLYETTAICRYIDASFPGTTLQPTDKQQAALMNQWISAVCDYFYNDMIRNWVLQYVFPKGPDGTPDMETIKASVAASRGHLKTLDDAYAGRQFLIDDQLTLADLFVAPIMMYLHRMPEGPDLLADFSNLRNAGEAMSQRSSYKATMPPPPPEQSAAAS